jgi:hypothetical protein
MKRASGFAGMTNMSVLKNRALVAMDRRGEYEHLPPLWDCFATSRAPVALGAAQ